MNSHSKPNKQSSVKDNILIVVFLFQIYLALEPLIKSKFSIQTLLSDSVQNTATASMFIASTFFLAISNKSESRQRKIATLLAGLLFVLGLIFALAKSWLEKSAEHI